MINNPINNNRIFKIFLYSVIVKIPEFFLKFIVSSKQIEKLIV